MKRAKLPRVAALLLALTVLLAACSSSGGGGEVDLTALSLDEITAKAKEEGKIESVGMPPDWANWAESWDSIEATHGLVHNDLDMSSSEELATFENEKSSPTKDIGDVGQAFGPIAVEMGVVQPYKPTTWDSIPDWAKDPDGNWIISYVGTMSFIVNGKLTDVRPQTWKDIQNSDCKIGLGDVIRGASSQAAVLSANLALGGTMEDIEPAMNFFKDLASQGRLDPGDLTQNRFVAGEIEVGVHWDYISLAWRDMALDADPGAEPYVHIATDGAVQNGYALVINKWSPHPHAAALTVEYLLSDAGQIERAKGYARPIRNDVVLPPEVQAIMLPDEQYANTIPITDNDAWKTATEEISVRWEEEIVPLITN